MKNTKNQPRHIDVTLSKMKSSEKWKKQMKKFIIQNNFRNFYICELSYSNHDFLYDP